MSDEDQNQQQQGGEEASQLRTQLGAQGATIKLQERQLAFAKHFPGVDPTSKPVVAMLSQYEGELSLEGLQKEAGEWGIQPPSTTSTTTQQQGDQSTQQQGQQQQGDQKIVVPASTQLSEAEKAAHAAAGTLGVEGQTDKTATPNPFDRGLERFNEAMGSGGKDREEAAAEWIDEVLGAAANGDQRVLVPNGRQGKDT